MPPNFLGKKIRMSSSTVENGTLRVKFILNIWTLSVFILKFEQV